MAPEPSSAELPSRCAQVPRGQEPGSLLWCARVCCFRMGRVGEAGATAALGHVVDAVGGGAYSRGFRGWGSSGRGWRTVRVEGSVRG